jgi:dihydrofolate reductase
MSPIVYHVATSVDGFIASPDGSWSAFPTVGDHIADYFASLSDYGTVLMGRRTYEVGLAHGVTNPYPTLRSIVVSRVLTTPPDPAIEVIGDDVVARSPSCAGPPTDRSTCAAGASSRRHCLAPG